MAKNRPSQTKKESSKKDADVSVSKDVKAKDTKPKDAKAKDAKQKDAAKGKDTKKASKQPAKKPNIFQRFMTYLHNVRLEVKRTTWPTRNEVFRMSLIVVGALIFFGVMIFLVDQLMVILLDWYSHLIPTVDPSAIDPSSIVPEGDAPSGGE